MVQDAVLVTAIGLVAFFALIPVSIVLLKSVLGSEEPVEPVEDVEATDHSDRPRQGSRA